MIVIRRIRLVSLLWLIIILQALFYFLALVKGWFHVIIIMLILEFVRVALFFCSAWLSLGTISPLLVFFFATFIVCEASLGLGLVVSLTRGRRNEAVIV